MNLDVIVWVNRVQREEAKVEQAAKAQLAEVMAKIRQAEADSGMELVTPSPSSAPKEAGKMDLFIASYGARRLARQARDCYGTAVTKLTEESTALEERVEECRAAVEAVKEERSQILEAAQRHKFAVSQTVAKELASLDEKGEGFQQGCACGFGIGCLALAGYVAFSLVMITLGKQSSAASPIGIVFMTMFVAPIGISVLLQLIFGLKRMMVEAELSARTRQAEEVCESVSEKANEAFKAKEPGLAKDLEQAEETAQKVAAALRKLKGEPEPGPEEEQDAQKSED